MNQKQANGAIVALTQYGIVDIDKISFYIKKIFGTKISDVEICNVQKNYKQKGEIMSSLDSKSSSNTKIEGAPDQQNFYRSKKSSRSGQIPSYVKKVLQKKAITSLKQDSLAQFEEQKDEENDEIYKKIVKDIKSSQASPNPTMESVTVRLLISASQFQFKQYIDIQFLNELRASINYPSIQWVGCMIGETLNGRGKYIYIHCLFDVQIIKDKHFLQRFLLETFPDSYYSYNSLFDQKIQIFSYSKFDELLDEYESKYMPNLPYAKANHHDNKQIRYNSYPYNNIVQNPMRF